MMVPAWQSVFPRPVPHVAITIRRFGKRTFSAEDLVEQKALPENVKEAAELALMTRKNILVSGGNRIRQDHLAQCADRTATR